VTTIDDLSEIESRSVEAVYACHVLEHVDRYDVLRTLQEWHRVLIPGGELRVAVPDFETMVELYAGGVHLERIWGLFYGGQRTEWDSHRVVFDYETLATYLQKAGFYGMEKYNAYKWLDRINLDAGSYIDFSTATINGILISLNVVGFAK